MKSVTILYYLPLTEICVCEVSIIVAPVVLFRIRHANTPLSSGWASSTHKILQQQVLSAGMITSQHIVILIII